LRELEGGRWDSGRGRPERDEAKERERKVEV